MLEVLAALAPQQQAAIEGVVDCHFVLIPHFVLLLAHLLPQHQRVLLLFLAPP